MGKHSNLAVVTYVWILKKQSPRRLSTAFLDLKRANTKTHLLAKMESLLKCRDREESVAGSSNYISTWLLKVSFETVITAFFCNLKSHSSRAVKCPVWNLISLEGWRNIWQKKSIRQGWNPKVTKHISHRVQVNDKVSQRQPLISDNKYNCDS